MDGLDEGLIRGDGVYVGWGLSGEADAAGLETLGEGAQFLENDCLAREVVEDVGKGAGGGGGQNKLGRNLIKRRVNTVEVWGYL